MNIPTIFIMTETIMATIVVVIIIDLNAVRIYMPNKITTVLIGAIIVENA